MQLYLIRHAQSANNAQPEHLRVEDPEITPLGHRQAAALAEWMATLPIRRLIASPFLRSLQTAHYLYEATSLVPEVWTDLHEQGGCYRGWEPECYQGRPGLTHEQIAARFPDFVVEPSIDGSGWWKSKPYETAAQARARAERLVERTYVEFSGTNEVVALVMHADFKRLVVEQWLSPTVTDGWLGPILNTGVTHFRIVDGAVRMDSFNSAGHLPHSLWSS